MLADESTIKPGLYRVPEDSVGPRVLIPGFRSAKSVRGAFGWFSAGCIEQLAPGLAQYLNRHDTTPIKFTVAPVLFPSEQAVIEKVYNMTEEEAAQRIADVFTKGRVQASAIGRHALDCLAWMIATGCLRLRVAVPKLTATYHPKIWLFEDGLHQVLARGSGNATARGIAYSIEHLDVDVTWLDHSRTRVRDGVKILKDWARGRSAGIKCVVEIPEALKKGIIQTAPDIAPSQADYLRAVTEEGNPKWAIDLTDRLRARLAPLPKSDPPRLKIPDNLEWRHGPYAHQGDAVIAWETEPSPEHGTISMATGAGKTITALICATRVQERLSSKPLLVVVSAPSIPLIIQWREELKKFGIIATVPSLETNTDRAITKLFRGLISGGTHFAIVTNNLLCSPNFKSTFATKIGHANTPIQTMFIADEAHTLGTTGFLSNSPDFFQRRLALSATPERQHDPDGTEKIFEFFGPPVYEFGLDRAIGFCLSPYNYYVHAATIDGDELGKFKALTRKIGAVLGRNLSDEDDTLTSFVIARRRIIETAQSKLALLRKVLKLRGPRSLEHTLIYASAKNPEQFDRIAMMLTDLNIRWAPVTQDTTANRSQLNLTLETFGKGGYQVLLAKKVLDEGVDIPSIREAFIVASSTVHREWIQRRGRVLRRHPEKPWAIIHDFLALPPAKMLRFDEETNIKRIISSELKRAYAFTAHARNAPEDGGVFSDLDRIKNAYWPNEVGSPILQQAGDNFIATATPKGKPW